MCGPEAYDLTPPCRRPGRRFAVGSSPGQARCAHKVTSSKANEAKVTPMSKKRRRRIRRHRTATLREPAQDLAALELHRQKRHAKLAAMADFIQRLRPTQNTQDRPRDQAGRNSPKERREESRSVDEGTKRELPAPVGLAARQGSALSAFARASLYLLTASLNALAARSASPSASAC